MKEFSVVGALRNTYPAGKEARIKARQQLFMDKAVQDIAAKSVSNLATPTKLADVIQQLEIVKRAVKRLMKQNKT